MALRNALFEGIACDLAVICEIARAGGLAAEALAGSIAVIINKTLAAPAVADAAKPAANPEGFGEQSDLRDPALAPAPAPEHSEIGEADLRDAPAPAPAEAPEMPSENIETA